MARLALIGMNVTMQRRELARLDALGRHRRLSDAESTLLAELVRLDAQRERGRRRCTEQALDRAQARVAQLIGQTQAMGIAA